MLNTISNLIICPDCQTKPIIIKKLSLLSAIYSCKCAQYPLVDGILYLKKDHIREKLIDRAIKGKNYLYLFAFSIKAKMFFRFIDDRHLFNFLKFKALINFIVLLGFPIGFAKYILARNRMPSFFLGLLSFDLISSKGVVLDIGCSMGQFFPFIYRHCQPNNFIAIEKDFFSLFIARNFFADKKTVLICYDVNNGLPIKKNSVDNFIIIDTLHYIKNIVFFFKNLKNVVKNDAEGAIVHTLNIQVVSPLPCYKRKPSDLNDSLRQVGFRNINMLSNTNLWYQLKNLGQIKIKKEKNIDESHIYNVLFTKRKIIKYRSYYKQLLKKTNIDYYQDAYLTNK